MKNKICPTCQRRYGELENYCTKCGIPLEFDKNRCSENKTRMCEVTTFKDDDIYCSYCGSLTTFAKMKQEDDKKQS